MSELDSKNENAMAGTGNDSPSVNREIKDGVFKLLFETPENAAELYSALKDDTERSSNKEKSKRRSPNSLQQKNHGVVSLASLFA